MMKMFLLQRKGNECLMPFPLSDALNDMKKTF